MVTSLPYSHVDSDLRVLAAQAEGSVAEPSVASMGPLLCLDSSGEDNFICCGWCNNILTLYDDGPGLLEMNVGKRATLDCLEDSGTIQLDITRESTDSKLFLGVTLRSMIKRCSLEQILPMFVQIVKSQVREDCV
ncbi:hypothetical protein OIU85_017266 [Salix viminalis]|uniref:Uncharacterized protein n=1 Tax=Salix viminalis TaxID=40686 RepID=A0A9Q0V6Z5_SALVM|nr:hypothetical protein OIU85_017266 [Salix viminalis]